MKTMRLFLLSALIFGATLTNKVYGMMATDASEAKPSNKRHEHPLAAIEDEQPAKRLKSSPSDSKDAKNENTPAAPAGGEPASAPKDGTQASRKASPGTEDAKEEKKGEDGNVAQQPDVSIFDLSSLNKRLAALEFKGGILQLELWIHQVRGDYEKRKHIILHHVINGKSQQIGFISLIIYQTTARGQGFTEIMWPSLKNINLECLLFLAALYEGYQDNKSEIAKILPITSADNLLQIRTYLWKGFGFCRIACPTCKLALPYDLKKLETTECRCENRMAICNLLLHDFTTAHLSEILENKGKSCLDHVCKSLK